MNQQSKSFYQALRDVTESNVSKTLEVAETKTNIINKVLNGSNKDNMKVLSIGCNLVVMGLAKQGHDVTVVNATESCVESINNVFKLPMKLDTDPDGAVNLMVQESKFDLVLALDQSLTFFDTEEEQKQIRAAFTARTQIEVSTARNLIRKYAPILRGTRTRAWPKGGLITIYRCLGEYENELVKNRYVM